MDSKAEYLSEHISDPFEYLRQLRQTTEPIGGSTEYAEDGELVEYDVAIVAIKKTIDKVATWYKSALLAEIERRKEKCDTFYNIALSNNAKLAKVAIEEQKRHYNSLLSFIDTIEVKEVGVDLGDPKGDKSVKYIIDTKTLEVKEVDLDKEWEEYFKYRGDVATVNIKHLAKHFFELGMRFSAIGSDYIEGVRGYYETTTK